MTAGSLESGLRGAWRTKSSSKIGTCTGPPPRKLVQRRTTYKVSFLGVRVPLDLRFRGHLEAKSFLRGPKIDPPGAQGRVFDLKRASCGHVRRCTPAPQAHQFSGGATGTSTDVGAQKVYNGPRSPFSTDPADLPPWPNTTAVEIGNSDLGQMRGLARSVQSKIRTAHGATRGRAPKNGAPFRFWAGCAK